MPRLRHETPPPPQRVIRDLSDLVALPATPKEPEPMRSFRPILGAAIAASLSMTLVLAQASPPATGAADVPDIKYEAYALPNGLRVILSEDHRLPLVAVNL